MQNGRDLFEFRGFIEEIICASGEAFLAILGIRIVRANQYVEAGMVCAGRFDVERIDSGIAVEEMTAEQKDEAGERNGGEDRHPAAVHRSVFSARDSTMLRGCCLERALELLRWSKTLSSRRRCSRVQQLD